MWDALGLAGFFFILVSSLVLIPALKEKDPERKADHLIVIMILPWVVFLLALGGLGLNTLLRALSIP